MPADASAVLVVGAGLSGATAAAAIHAAGRPVLVLDKGRGPGGRLSTRRTPSGGFDHGAPVAQATGPAFLAHLQRLSEAGVVAARGEGEWVGVPGMNRLVAHALEGLDVRWGAAVARLSRNAGHWQAWDASGSLLGTAPCLLLAVPAPQARALLASALDDPEIDAAALSPVVRALGSVAYRPCWAAMLRVAARPSALSRPREASQVIARLEDEALKPERTPGHWVLHATPAWSEKHLEDAASAVAEALGEAFLAETGLPSDAIEHIDVHRWRYAFPVDGLVFEGLPGLGLELAGDAILAAGADGAPPAERAWCSGVAAALRILGAQPKS